MPIRAAIYARVSSEQQMRGSGIDVQVAECLRYAADHGYEVFNTYRDDGISGAHKAARRHGLSQLLDDAAEGKFKVLLVHELDRLARELSVGLQILAIVTETGIRLIEASTNTPFDDHGALQSLVKMWSAGEDRKRILTRTKRGHIARAKKGQVSGPPPLGYDKNEDGRLVINREEADLVRRIYSLYLEEKKNFESIAVLLNAEGIPTKRARLNQKGKNKFQGPGAWQRSTIACIFRNPVYKGEAVYGKTQGRVRSGKQYVANPKRPLTKPYLETALKNRDALPHEEVVIPVPAIVDIETWERARQQSEQRYARMTQTAGATKHTYNFTGIVRCHECGRLMTRMKMPRKRSDGTVVYHGYYQCKNKENNCPNANKHHRMDLLDIEIMGRLLPYLDKPELVRTSLDTTLTAKRKEHAVILEARDKKLARLGQLDAELARLRDALYADLISHVDFRRDQEKRVLERETLQAELAEFDQRLERLNLSREQERVDLVVDTLSTLRVSISPGYTLHNLFSNRFEMAAKTLGKKAESMTVLEILELSAAYPDPENPDYLMGRKFLQVLQALVKRVTVNTSGEIVDYVLEISQSPSPDVSDGDCAKDHKANLKCITSPSLTS